MDATTSRCAIHDFGNVVCNNQNIVENRQNHLESLAGPMYAKLGGSGRSGGSGRVDRDGRVGVYRSGRLEIYDDDDDDDHDDDYGDDDVKII